MKKLFVLLICFVLPFGAAASAESWRVFDNAGVFSQEDIAAIEEAIADFQRATYMDFAVLTTDDFLGNENQDSIAESFYNSMGFGLGKLSSGFLFYLDTNHRYTYVYRVDDSTATLCVEFFLINLDAWHPYLVDGDYKTATLAVIELARKALNDAT